MISTIKLRVLASVFLILGSVFAIAQSTLNKGVINIANNKYDPVIHGEDENYIYVAADHAYADYKIEAYDKKTLKRQYSTSLDHDRIDKKYAVDIERISLLDDRFVVFYSYLDKKAKEFTLFAKSFDKTNGKQIGNRKDIYTIPVEKKSRKGDFTVLVSENSSRIFIKHIAYYKKLKKDIIHFTLLGQGLETLFQHKIDEEAEWPNSYIVDNDGSIYYIKYRDSDLFVGSFDANRDYEKWEEKINFANIGEMSLHNLEFNINSKGDFTITGLVSTKSGEKNKQKISGSLFIKIDRESKEQKVAKVNEFSEEFFEQFRSKRDIKKERQGDVQYNFTFENVLDKEDGGVIMSMESYYQIDYYNNGNHTGRSVEYGDILLMNFDNEGNMLWANRVPKRQSFWWSEIGGLFVASSRGLHFLLTPSQWKTTRHFSYSMGIKDGKLVLFHNDLSKNILEKKISDKYKRFKKPRTATVVKYEFDLISGERNKSVYNSWPQKGVKMCPVDYYQKSDNSDLYLFGIKGRKYSFFRL